MSFSLGQQDSHSVAYFKRSVFCIRCTIGAAHLLNCIYSNMSNLKSVVSLGDFSSCRQGSLKAKTSETNKQKKNQVMTMQMRLP